MTELLQKPWSREILGQPGGGFVARIPELEGCFVGADAAEEALDLLEGALEAWLALALDQGTPIPEPRLDIEGPFSGRFSVRVPRSLHRQLVQRAAQEQTSLNQYVVTLLASGLASVGHNALAPDHDAREPITADAVRSDQRSVPALKGIASFLRQRGDVSLACLVYAFAASRIAAFESREDASRELAMAGALARRENRSRLAVALLQESLKLDGTNLRANSALGQLLYREGRYVEAIPHLEEASGVDNYARTYLGWSKVLLGLDRGDEALRKGGLSDLTDALRKWSYQNASKNERQSWLRHLQRLSQLGDNYRQEVEQLRAFANTNARWGPIGPLDKENIDLSDSDSDSDLIDEPNSAL